MTSLNEFISSMLAILKRTSAPNTLHDRLGRLGWNEDFLPICFSIVSIPVKNRNFSFDNK